MFYQLVHNSQLAQQQSPLSSKNQTPNPTIVRVMSPSSSHSSATLAPWSQMFARCWSACVSAGAEGSQSAALSSPRAEPPRTRWAARCLVPVRGRVQAPGSWCWALGRTGVQQGGARPSVRRELAPSGGRPRSWCWAWEDGPAGLHVPSVRRELGPIGQRAGPVVVLGLGG